MSLRQIGKLKYEWIMKHFARHQFHDRSILIDIIDKGILMLYSGRRNISLTTVWNFFLWYYHRFNKLFTLAKHPFIILSRLYGVSLFYRWEMFHRIMSITKRNPFWVINLILLFSFTNSPDFPSICMTFGNEEVLFS